MGGKSQKQTTGYKYRLGGHQVICMGPIDKVTQIRVKDLVAWQGNSTGSSIYIDAEHLFGGSKEPITKPGFSGGDNSEANGVSGTVDIMMGGRTQPKNNYLMRMLGNVIPAFRGVVSAVLNQCYIGNSEYPEAWSFLGTRIHTKEWGEPQWYDAKAEITYDTNTILTEPWQYQVIPYHANPGYENLSVPTSGWQGSDTLPFDSNKIWLYPTPSGWSTPQLSICWVKKTLYNVPAGLVVQLRADNGCVMFVNGELVGASNRDNVDINSNDQYPVNFTIPTTGTYEIVGKAFSENATAIQGGNYLNVTLDAIAVGGDMNPAHWLRELYTSKRYGLGNPTSDVNDVALTAVADRLFNEKMGIALLWDNQKSAEETEDMFDNTLNHIDGVHYVNDQGLLTVKLIRDDYDINTLMVVDKSVYIRVEKYGSTNQRELVNAITGVYVDASTNQEASVMVAETALVQTQGIKSETIRYPFFTNASITIRRITSDLRKKSNSLLAFDLVCNRKVSHLNIGDVFILNLPDYDATNVVMRIFDKKKGDGKNNEIRLVCTQDVYSLPAQAIKVVTPDSWVDPRGSASPVPAQLTFELPYYELVQAQGQTEVDSALVDTTVGALGVAAVRPNGSSINAQIMVDSGGGYRGADELDFSPSALLATAMGYTTTSITFTNDVDVDLVHIGSHAQIGDELVVIQALDSAARTATVGRGVLDTIPQKHVVGDRIWFWDFYNASDSQSYIDGQTINVKVLPNSSSGRLPIAAASAQSLTFHGRAARPYPPGNFKVNGVAFGATVTASADINFSWAHRDRLLQTAGTLQDTTYGDIGPEPGTTYTLRIYNQYNLLIRTQSAISGTSYLYTTVQEQLDNGGGGSSQIVDPLWSKTPLLLNFNAANNSTTFVDGSGNFLTPLGDAKISTAQYMYGGASAVFDGTGDCLTITDSSNFQLSGDFTIECWIRPTVIGSLGAIITTRRNDNVNYTPVGLFFSAAGKLRLVASNSNTAYQIDMTGTVTMSINTWYHVAAVRSGNNWYLFVNGALDTSTTSSIVPYTGSGTTNIGGDTNANFFTGYIDDVRVTKGTGRYTSTFTKPFRQLEKYVKDINWSDNVLALIFEDSNNSTNIIDASDSKKTISVFGNAKISTSQFKFGSSALSLDGGGTTFISAPFDSTYAGTSNFTLEGFIYTSDVTRAGTIACTTALATGSRAGWCFSMTNTGRLYVEAWTNSGSSAFSIFPSNTLSVNTWYHVALVRNGTTWAVYLNGTGIGSATESAAIGVSGDGLYIGRDQWTLITWLGYMDDFRVRSGAKYTADFSAPTTSFLPIDAYWSNVVLLANMNGANNAVLFENVAELNKLLTANGDVKISTTQSKFGGSAAYFDGTGDYLTYPDSNDFYFGSGDFTIECWVYGTFNSGGYIPIYSQLASTGSDSNRTIFYYSASTDSIPNAWVFYDYISSSNILLGVADAPPTNTWFHIAVTKQGSSYRFFRDGVLIGTVQTSSNAVQNVAGSIYIGTARLTGVLKYFTGYMDDFRITRSARYVSNFTPPGAQLGKYVPSLNTQLRIELESVRGGLVSSQKYNHTITRSL